MAQGFLVRRRCESDRLVLHEITIADLEMESVIILAVAAKAPCIRLGSEASARRGIGDNKRRMTSD